MLIHAQKNWGLVGMAHLWTYTIRLENDAINESPNMQNIHKHSPLQTYTGIEVYIYCKYWKPFDCPVYVLREELQDNKRNVKQLATESWSRILPR